MWTFNCVGRVVSTPTVLFKGQLTMMLSLPPQSRANYAFHPNRMDISDFTCFQYSARSSQGQGQLKVIHVSEMSNLNTLFRKAVTFGKTSALNSQTQGDVQVRD